MLFADLELSRRLEQTEAEAGAAFVKARAQLSPGCGAAFTKIAGAYVLFDGPQSPITQTFGLGMFEPVTPAAMDSIEAFLGERGATVFHEVCPMADPSTLALLNERCYFPMEFTTILYLPLTELVVPDSPSNVSVRQVAPSDGETFAQTMATGWQDVAGELTGLLDLGRIMAAREDGPSFLAEIDGKPVAAASMFVHQGVALMAGACTIPSGRMQGAQRALIAARQRYARDARCDLLMMSAAPPGASSQRNAERQGFRIAYTRIKWQQRTDSKPLYS